ncbi:DUF3800 domain-containing protein [Dyadobacter sp. CY107]|uniref:DUF3800 domain-containing protein n=1 Tax=Dyadobacter fanqingshengii TaxID=2906443 RepID=UPI001F2E4E27|nr:DUF3800 domain-containing protein [Dyadobacter fanqingshengii]MCF2505728.1 DUF3800 domain-containing protein [Dyadobacter fanqingshengii]
MYFCYIDESGDVGKMKSPSQFFVLSALCVHESAWQTLLDDLIKFRRHLKKVYGLTMAEEIHASVFINGNPNLKAGISKNHKILILRECLRFLNARSDISIVTVRIEKNPGYANDVFEYAWKLLIQRIDNTLKAGNFPGALKTDKGLIISDNTDEMKLRKLLRKMRRFNLVPSKFRRISLDAKITGIIEDPVSRDSKSSYIHQMVDVVCYFARQYYEPNKTIRKKGLRNFYMANLENVLNKNISPKNTVNYILEQQA